MKSTIEWIRQSQRVIRMVSELHRLGYQRLRVMPFVHPLAYRVMIAPISHFSAANGALIVNFESDLVTGYSSASSNHYFGWIDAANDDARALAVKFIARFPAIAAAGNGRDWAYAGWSVELLGHLERQPDRLPVVQSEYGPDPLQLADLPFWSYPTGTMAGTMLLPPPGEAPAPPPAGMRALNAMLDEQRVTSFSALSKQMGLCIAAGLAIASLPQDFDYLCEDGSWHALVMQAHAALNGGRALIGTAFADEATLRESLTRGARY